MFLAGKNAEANAKKFVSSRVGSRKIYFTILFILLFIVAKVSQ